MKQTTSIIDPFSEETFVAVSAVVRRVRRAPTALCVYVFSILLT